MRDPSGMLPCYYGSWDDIFYVASDVPLLCEASGQQPAIDWHELGRTLYVNGLPQRTTALAGIFQLLRSEEHTSELQSLMRISYAVFCLKKKKIKKHAHALPTTLLNTIITPLPIFTAHYHDAHTFIATILTQLSSQP